jgi:hypothetical protein
MRSTASRRGVTVPAGRVAGLAWVRASASRRSSRPRSDSVGRRSPSCGTEPHGHGLAHARAVHVAHGQASELVREGARDAAARQADADAFRKSPTSCSLCGTRRTPAPWSRPGPRGNQGVRAALRTGVGTRGPPIHPKPPAVERKTGHRRAVRRASGMADANRTTSRSRCSRLRDCRAASLPPEKGSCSSRCS